MKRSKLLSLVLLMIVGESIFLLPFVVTRVFRPTFLTVFDITNLELGKAFSLYGIIAMASYFLGGPIADRFRPKNLIVLSLIITGAAGFVMAQVPDILSLTLLYGFWGFSTILLFWASYIKGIREFGGEESQGKSYGLIDGGRGFVAALIASSSVLLLDAFLPVSADLASEEDLTTALSKIINLFSAFCIVFALFVWILLPKRSDFVKSERLNLDGVKKAIDNKSVWFQAIILLCAYVGYKSTDDFGLYAADAFGYDDVESAHIATISFWVRPIAAVLAGYLGDRFIHSRVTKLCFFILIIGSLVIASGVLQKELFVFIAITIASVSLGIYGLRGLYYALFQESKLPLSYAGAAIGFVSVIGYTPDVFWGPLMGIVLDNNPGEIGHQYLFLIVATFGLLGLISTYLFTRSVK